MLLLLLRKLKIITITHQKEESAPKQSMQHEDSYQPEEMRQNRVCSTKIAPQPEESAPKQSMQHEDNPTARRKCAKTEYAAQR